MSTHCHATTSTSADLHDAIAHHAAVAAEADAALKKADAIFRRYVRRDEIIDEDEIFVRIAVSDDPETNLREFFKARDELQDVPEYEAQETLKAALPLIASAADVAAVVEHAEAQGQRKLGGSHDEIMRLRRLVDVLSVKLYGPAEA